MNLRTKTADGRTFHPVYTVNDWGIDGWFIGVDYQCSAWGSHSIREQTDYQIVDPFTADALWPDGTIQRVRVVVVSTRACAVCDMGRDSTVYSPVYGVRFESHGAEATISAKLLFFDLATLATVAPA